MAQWFMKEFGVSEGKYAETKALFAFEGDHLTVKHSGKRLYVGAFETPRVEELRKRWAQCQGDVTQSGTGGLKFAHTTGDVRTLHRDAANAGAVFQVASQFNCLEMVGPRVRPEDGITRYYADKTQGPACAMSCPAGTLFRNYFVNGRGQAGSGQIDCLKDISECVGNAKAKYYEVINGYCLPLSAESMRPLATALTGDASMREMVRSRLRIGVHWDTSVAEPHQHRVAQVFSSACPVAYTKSTRSADWAPFASAVLDATYEGTLLAAAILAAERKGRVKVYLTAVGGGAFGNRDQWIVSAIHRALYLLREAPLDVFLVHYSGIPKGIFQQIGSPSLAPHDVAT